MFPHDDPLRVSQGPLLVAASSADAAALAALGLQAVERPPSGGVSVLAARLSDVPPEREIIVLGTREETADGKQPAKEWAIRTATRLAEALHRPIGWALPPDDAKDNCSWLGSMPPLPEDRLVDLFLSGLDTRCIQPPARFLAERDTSPAIPLAQWRDRMRQVRIESWGRPGDFLDASPTGAGKSHIDASVLMQLLQGETA